jgi:hypothetical protein
VYDAALLLLPAWCGMSLSANRFTRMASAVVATPLLLWAGFWGPPMSALFGLGILVFLVSLVWTAGKAPGKKDPSQA